MAGLSALVRAIVTSMEEAAVSTKPPMAKAKISAKLYTYNKMDVDNLFARLKWPLDWLTRRGYILDDDPEILDWQGIPKQAVDRKNQRLEIQLEEIIDEDL